MAILNGNACMGCHALRGEGGAVGPGFDGIGSRLSRDKIRESIMDPNADASAGYEAFKGMMPTNFGTDMSAAQVEALVRFLAGLK
jgi:cytochrome c551/c552